MSHYICVFDRSGHDMDPELLRRLAEPLEFNNASIQDVCQGPCGVLIGHKAAHSRRPKSPSFIADPETGITLAVAGQINFIDPAKKEQNTNGLPIEAFPPNAVNSLNNTLNI